MLGTKSLMLACIGTKVRNFIFSSTAAVYKDGSYKVTEKSITKPKSVYGKTKLIIEEMLADIQKASKDWKVMIL